MEQIDLATDPDLVPLLKELAKRCGFTKEDLRQNRDGRMSERQRGRFERWVLLGVCRLVAMVMIVGFGFSQLVGARTGTSNRVANGIIGVVVLVLGSVMIWLGARLLMRLVLDLKNGKTASVEGLGATVTRGTSGNRLHYYVIGSRRFRVFERALQALAPGIVYRAYYTPHTNSFLSIEPLRRRQPRQTVASQGERSDGAAQG